MARFRRPGRGHDPADLPIHRWVDDHALDLLEGPETSNWRPETTNWVNEILTWAEQDAQAEQQEQNRDAEETRPVGLLNFRNRRRRSARVRVSSFGQTSLLGSASDRYSQRTLIGVHHTVAFLVVAATFGAAALAGWAYYRRTEPRGIVTHLLALAQTLLVAQVGLGLILLSDHRRAPDHLHYLYGTLSLCAVLSPWLYAPAERRRRLAWFAGATLVAGALAVRAYLTGVG